MYNTIDFQKFTDIIDESVMRLYFLKKEDNFPETLKVDLLNILNFFAKTKENKIEEVLHDNMISIDINDLKRVKEKLLEVNIDINISSLIEKIESIGSNKISKEEIDILEQELIKLSIPLWQTTI